MMKDEIVIAEALNGQVRIHAARTTAMVKEAAEVHHCWPTSAAALGRTMTVTALMASDLKDPEEHVVVTIDGKGPAGKISVQADGAGNVRGMIGNPEVYLSRADGHLDVGKAVGIDGTLSVSRDMGLKEPFTGVVALQTGENGDDFAYYLVRSEQTPSVVAVGVLVGTDTKVKTAGGMIIQLLPDASEETIEAVEQVTKTMKPMTEYMDEGIEVEDLIRLLFPDAAILEHKPVQWHCGCSKEYYGELLLTLHEKDLKDMMEEDHGAEITCSYCEKQYRYSEEELKQLLEKKQCGKSAA